MRRNCVDINIKSTAWMYGLRALLQATALLTVLTGCGKSPKVATAVRPPAQVGVVVMKAEAVAISTELPGRIDALRIAEVRARVDGIVLKRLFVEGSEVKEGQVLYQIDPAPYQAALESSKATLARAEANISAAKLQAERYHELSSFDAVSKQEYANALATLQAYEADAALGRAAVKTASINLGYTSITSPISGRIGKSSVTEGAYVQQSQATLMATVQQLDPIYVDLTQSSTDLLRLKDELASGRMQSDGPDQAKVKLILDDGRDYLETGTLQFSDVTVDQSTGSVTLRALIPNPRGDLLPGMFVRARLDQGINPQAILVPQMGVSRNQKGEATAFIVSSDNKVEQRIISAERAVGDKWLVIAGLTTGDRVIVEGLQMLRPGVQVNPIAPQSLASAGTP
ncbi:MAG TPA: efflux RND transporter periplasmic adaptor subunit [Opitutaceae bacterium]|nr:efflux RND transporter periplasmic adaptor subunit [Opitutaceae bacterium]